MDGKILLHNRTLEQIERFLDNPSHALLLSGPVGTGKGYVAKYIAGRLLGLDMAMLTLYPYLTIIVPDDKGTLSVDMVRGLQHDLRLSTTGDKPIRRIVIIDGAEAMSIEAQNAFLKLLEEPPSDTVFVLTVPSSRSLLPTISSRTQSISVSAPSQEDVLAYFATNEPDALKLKQNYFLSDGLPGLLHALLGESQDHPLVKGVEQAKTILKSDVTERLKMVDTLCKNKSDTEQTVKGLQRIAQAGISQVGMGGSSAQLERWHKVLNASTAAIEALRFNANTKLTITNLMLNI